MNIVIKIKSMCIICIGYSIGLFANDIKILDFDIGGVKLKMDPIAVIKKIKSTYNLKDEDILLYRKGTTWAEKYKKDMNLSKVRSLKVKRDKNTNIYLNFCISEDNNIPEVRTMEYGIMDTKENRKKMYDKAIKKYGKPSFSSYSKTTHTWCDENKKTRIMGHVYKCTKENPRIFLVMSYSNISLQSNECELNNFKIRENKKMTTPHF